LICSAALLITEIRLPSSNQDSQLWLARLYLTEDSEIIQKAIKDSAVSSRPRWDLAAAVFRDVLPRNAASPTLWCQLGEAIEQTGDLRNAEYCFRRGLQLAPYSLQILLDVGDFYFNINNYSRALPYFSTILNLIQEYDHNIFVYYERMEVRKRGLLGAAIPNARAARAYLRYLIADGEVPPVREVWDWIRTKRFDDDVAASGYIDFLIAKGQIEQAAEAWAGHYAPRKNGYLTSSYLFNGDFEYEPTGSPLDWRVSELPGVQVIRDPESPYLGKFCLRIGFSGSANLEYHHVSQRAFVRPGRYRLGGYMRTSAITTDQGVGIHIAAADGSVHLSAQTEALAGTNPWTHIDATFEVTSATKMIEVRVVRMRSLRFDNQISGTVWIDELTLSRVR